MLPRLLFLLGVFGAVSLFLAPAQAGTQDASKEALAGLVAASDRIAEFEVVSAQPVLGPDGVIETRYHLQTRTRIKGLVADIEELRMPGGEVAGRGLVIPGLPRLAVGDRAILFLSQPTARGWRFPVGLKAGVVPVRADVAERRAAILDEVQRQGR